MSALPYAAGSSGDSPARTFPLTRYALNLLRTIAARPLPVASIHAPTLKKLAHHRAITVKDGCAVITSAGVRQLRNAPPKLESLSRDARKTLADLFRLKLTGGVLVTSPDHRSALALERLGLIERHHDPRLFAGRVGWVITPKGEQIL